MTGLDDSYVLHDRRRHKSVVKAVAGTSATDAQLTVHIISETKDAAVAEQSTGVLITAGDVCDAGHESHSCWRGRLISSVFVVPQLAHIVPAPAPQLAVLVNGAVVVSSSTDHHSRVRGISQRDRMRSCVRRCAQHVVIVDSNALQPR